MEAARLKPKEAAAYLGWKVQTLYNNAWRIPHNSHGYRKQDLDKFINR